MAHRHGTASVDAASPLLSILLPYGSTYILSLFLYVLLRCLAVEERLSGHDAVNQMALFHKEGVAQLFELSSLVRGQLTALERKVGPLAPFSI